MANKDPAGLHDNIPELVESCDSFFYQYLLPEIVSHRILKTKASSHPKVAPLSNVGEDNELMGLWCRWLACLIFTAAIGIRIPVEAVKDFIMFTTTL